MRGFRMESKTGRAHWKRLGVSRERRLQRQIEIIHAAALTVRP